jgi:hypothetical protein
MKHSDEDVYQALLAELKSKFPQVRYWPSYEER